MEAPFRLHFSFLLFSSPLVKSIRVNRLLFGDNLKWLRDTKIFPDVSVDLVYLDPLLLFCAANGWLLS